MKKLRTGTVLAIAVLALSAVMLFVDSTRERAYAADAPSVVPALAEPPTATDPTPTFESHQLEELGVTPDSLRFLTNAADSTSWAATNSDGDVCLVVEASGDSGLAGAACRSAVNFFHSGTSLRLVDGAGAGVVVHLLPPDIVSTAAQASLNQAVEDVQISIRNDLVTQGAGGSAVIVLQVAEANALGEVAIPREVGRDFVLRTL